MSARSLTVTFASQRAIRRFMLTLMICFAQWVWPQDRSPSRFSRYELFGGYLAAGQAGGYTDLNFTPGAEVPSTFSSTHGVDVSFLRNFNNFLGIKGDFSLQPHKEGFLAGVCIQLPCSPVVQTSTINPRLFNFLVGPEVKLRNRSRFTPYAHGLIGVAHATASFSTSGSAASISFKTSSTGFATAVGGGADIRLGRRLSFRTGMDFNPVWVGQESSETGAVIKNVRIWGGILFH